VDPGRVTISPSGNVDQTSRGRLRDSRPILEALIVERALISISDATDVVVSGAAGPTAELLAGDADCGVTVIVRSDRLAGTIAISDGASGYRTTTSYASRAYQTVRAQSARASGQEIASTAAGGRSELNI
jgi:hypothetical protein